MRSAQHIKYGFFFAGLIVLSIGFGMFSSVIEGSKAAGFVFAQQETGNTEKLLETQVFTEYSGDQLKKDLGQMMLIGFEGTELTPELLYVLLEIRPGGILLLKRNIRNEDQTKKLISDLQAVSLQISGYPLFVAVDQEGEPIARIRWAKVRESQAELTSFSEAYLVGKKRAKELKELGFNMNLAPVLDSRNEGDFIFSRSFQKSDEISQEVVKGLIRGHETEQVFVVPKHFPGYDGISYNPETQDLPVVSALPTAALFRDTFESTKQEFVMVSHVVYEDVDPTRPFPFSTAGIRFLREELSNDIIVMSDDLTSNALLGNYASGEIGARAISGGVNILLVAGHSRPEGIKELYRGLVKLVEQDEGLQKEVQASAVKIYETKEAMVSAAIKK